MESSVLLNVKSQGFRNSKLPRSAWDQSTDSHEQHEPIRTRATQRPMNCSDPMYVSTLNVDSIQVVGRSLTYTSSAGTTYSMNELPPYMKRGWKRCKGRLSGSSKYHRSLLRTYSKQLTNAMRITIFPTSITSGTYIH